MTMAGIGLCRPSWLLATLIVCCTVQYSVQVRPNSTVSAHGTNHPIDGNTEPLTFDNMEEKVSRRKRFMIMLPSKHWPQGIIPYKFTSVDDRNKKDIVAAMAYYEYLTYLRFPEWDPSLVAKIGHRGFIGFKTTWGRGWSLLGFVNTRYGQSLDCPRQRTCVHELGHALGYEHEQYHPERDRWIAINMPNVQFELESWKKLGWKDMGKTHFDYASFMLYPPNFHEYDVLFPELYPFQQRPFYMFKELCEGYSCDQAPQCIDKQLSCANEGYVSVVNDKCSCVCLPGLDPATECTTIIGNGHGKWPSGLFSLLEHKDGCPSDYFREGTITHYGNGDNELVSPDFKGELSGVKAQLSFCTKTADSQSGQWPPGSYCFFKKGACPSQKGVYEGKITLFGDFNNVHKNSYTGDLPDGEAGLDPVMEYCCMHTGFPYSPVDLPNDKPFILLVKGGQRCQQVRGMSAKMEKFGLHTPQIYGDVSYEWKGKTAMIYYCVYTPADRNCGDIVELGPSKQSVTIESDKTNPANRECDWLFKTTSGAGGTIVLTFDEFEVPCDDYVEIQHTMVAQKGVYLCDNIKDRSVQALYDKLRLQYKTLSGSTSHFKATVKWIPDSKVCYDKKRNGATYRGTVNYTRDFEPCLPWSEVGKCLVIPNKVGFYSAGLDGNECRNPDNSFYPWCYTKLDGCKRDFCDVCQLEQPYDLADDCADRKRNGQCSAKDVDCAATCGFIKQGPSDDAHDTHCSRPGTVSGGTLVGPNKSSYDVGDSVTYKCTKSSNTIERSCQGNGKWSVANTACLPCPQGYTNFRDDCYKFYDKYVGYFDADQQCKDSGAELAIPRNIEENDFMDAFRYPINLVWIGATLEKKGFQTSKGDLITYFNWRWYDVPHPERCVYMREDSFWKDANACDWKFNFICRKPATDKTPECKDFLDNCPSMVHALNDSNCDLKPGLEGFCRYTCDKCPSSCQQEVQLSQSNRQYKISADRRSSNSRFCTWNIKPPSKDGRLVLKFENFDLPAEGDQCLDGVEVRKHKYGHTLTRFCNLHYNKTVIIPQDKMLVEFITPESSSSHFTANVEWISDSDMCYNVPDKGWSYDGKVNYTRTFQSCVSWTQALNCENNTLWNGYFLENLDHNYCRNPRPEEHNEQPYCYTESCVKQYCDVCHIEKPFDSSTDCQSFKTAGKCQSDPRGAATMCADTCRSVLDVNTVKVSEVTCSKPGSVPRGVLSSSKNSFKVGDQVKYQCQDKDYYVKRTCLASGVWSDANSACLDCPYGFIPYKESCYKYFPLYVDKDGANDHCKKFGGVVAAPKNPDQNHFIASLRENERIWLGGHKFTTEFKWNDGTSVSWLNWLKARKKFEYRDNCMVLEKNELWTDDWCRNKLFHFVCQVKPQREATECVDHLDVCSSLIQATSDFDCTNYPSLQLYCRSSCGMCLNNCVKNIQLNSNKQIYDINSGSDKFCSWNFKGDDKKGRFIVTLDEFDVLTPDSLILTLSDSSGYLHKYQDNSYQKITYVYADHLGLEFKGSTGSQSHFKATIRWVKDMDMCYNVGDKGWSYAGNVGYTKSYQKCLPWAQATRCPHSPIKNGDILDHLEGNACRNPDSSDQPWCYTSQCQKHTCDVCHLEKLEDVATDCAGLKAKGACTMESNDCAKTCQLDKDVIRVSNVRCSPPGAVSGGQLQGTQKSQYNVGDKVIYECTKSSFPVERVCLSSGSWSVANTACLACPISFTEFRGNCYKYVEKKLNYTDAEKECQKYDSKVARPKSSEENTFIAHTMRNAIDNRATATPELWIGARRDEKLFKFFWNDKTEVKWTNWRERQSLKKRDNCIWVEDGGLWYDDWCHDKNFNFVCQQKSYDNPECKDYVGNCPYLLSLTNKETCEHDSRMETLCRKTCGLCPKDCDHTVELSQTVPSYEIVSDRRTETSRYCTWQFNVPQNKQGRFVVQFEDFDVKIDGRQCMDTVEVKESLNGPPFTYYCNNNKDSEIEVMGDSLFVRFRTTTNSQSHIKAMVTWTDDDSMCYSIKDKGRSYSGDVSYTKDFQPCLPWAQTLDCHNHPLKEGNLFTHLEGNACRNPDNSERPWCFVNGCHKQFCDVCHLEKPFDNERDCAAFKAQGGCTSDKAKAIKECAATCNAVPSSQSNFKAIDVTCGDPQPVAGATLSSRVQDTYKVGDIATYKCPRSKSVVSSTCLTTGKWSAAKTPCLACSAGWVQFGDKCYRFVEQYIEYVDAEAECKKLSAIVSPAKTKAINDFLQNIVRVKRSNIWLGAHKNKESTKFFWSDGMEFSWTNWQRTKEMKKRDNCILFNGQWNDDWCHDKFFPFVCQLDKDDTPDCVDFMDTCPDYVSYKSHKCNDILNKYCRKSCGQCNE